VHPEVRQRGLALVVLVALVGASSSRHQQSGVLRGHLLSGVDSLPVADAFVTVQGPSSTKRQVVDSRGDFLIAGLPPGTYSLTVRALGYPVHRRAFTIAAGDTVTLSIVMVPHCQFDSLTAMRDIAAGHPRIVLQSGIAPIVSPWDSIVEKRYGFTYVELGDQLVDPMECLRRHNRVVFRFLDAKYGPRWRDSVRTR
jgi:hypothetical protein